jgi:hypothetical protein
MRKINDLEHLSFRDCNGSLLRVIHGNPSGIEESSDRSPPHLSLVWKQEGTLAKKGSKPNNKPLVSSQDPPPAQILLPIESSQRPSRFKEYAERIGVIYAVLTGLFLFVAWGAWHVSKYDSRLGALESVVNGPDGLTKI